MRQTNHLLILRRITFALAVVAFLLPNSGSAQEASQPAGTQKPAAQDAQNPADNKNTEPASPYGLAWADSYFRQIGSSGLLAGSREGIGWGSLYIASAGVSGIVQQFDSTSTATGNTYTVAVFQANVVDGHNLGSGRFAL